MSSIPEVKFTRSGSVDLAYQVFGDGPLDILLMIGWVSHLEVLWELPECRRFLERLSGMGRVALFDKRGTGLSDRPSEEAGTDEMVPDVLAVMDAAGMERAALVGWFDAAALKRSIQLNGVSGLCITKLDVLDGVEAVKICVGYQLEGTFSEILPVGAEELERAHPVYEELPGWMESTVGIRAYEALPKNARAYLKRIEELAGVPIDLISTGPDREETIVRRHPFDT